MLVEISDRHKLLYSKPRLRIRTSQSVAKYGQFMELKTSFRLEGFQSSLSPRDGIPPIPHPFVCCQSGSSTQTLSRIFRASALLKVRGALPFPGCRPIYSGPMIPARC